MHFYVSLRQIDVDFNHADQRTEDNIQYRILDTCDLTD
jgi:hypothetical protein